MICGGVFDVYLCLCMYVKVNAMNECLQYRCGHYTLATGISRSAGSAITLPIL